MHGQRNDAYHKREMHFLKFHKSRMEKHVRSRRLHFIQTTRLQEWWTWVVSFSISRLTEMLRAGVKSSKRQVHEEEGGT